jgi:hypothetical protein
MRFVPEEDAQLCELVGRYGMDRWEEIVRKMGNGRTARQLRERWQNYANPSLSRYYSETDDHALLAKYAEVGPRWAAIAATFPDKSAHLIRTHYRHLQKLQAKGRRPNSELRDWNPDAIENEMLAGEIDHDDELDSNFDTEY